MNKQLIYKCETRPFRQGGFVERQSPYRESNQYVGRTNLDLFDTVLNIFSKIGGSHEVNQFPTR